MNEMTPEQLEIAWLRHCIEVMRGGLMGCRERATVMKEENPENQSVQARCDNILAFCDIHSPRPDNAKMRAIWEHVERIKRR